MALTTTLRTRPDGSPWPNDDGSPHLVYAEDDPTRGIVICKHIAGTVTVPDGTIYNVTPDFISAPLEHHGAISHAIGVRFTDEGHPLHDAEHPFVHECTDHCGEVS